MLPSLKKLINGELKIEKYMELLTTHITETTKNMEKMEKTLNEKIKKNEKLIKILMKNDNKKE